MDITVRLHSVAEDGLPDMDRLTGRVALVFDGCVVSGWPVGTDEAGDQLWEADSDVGHNRPLYGVRHWLVLGWPPWSLIRSRQGSVPPARRHWRWRSPPAWRKYAEVQLFAEASRSYALSQERNPA